MVSTLGHVEIDVYVLSIKFYREQLVHKLKLEATNHEEKLERMKSQKMAELHVSSMETTPIPSVHSLV